MSKITVTCCTGDMINNLFRCHTMAEIKHVLLHHKLSNLFTITTIFFYVLNF